MSITITDSLTLDTVKRHLQIDVDFTDDDELIQTYMDNSLSFVTNYCMKTFETYENTESFLEWTNPMFLDWETEIRAAVIEYTDTLGATQTVDVVVYADNVIREESAVDYDGGNVTVLYTPYIEVMQVPISHQTRLLIVGDAYSFRENTVAGTQIDELSNQGVKNLLDTIKLGIM